MRFRQGGLIGHPEDYVDVKAEKPKRKYYWCLEDNHLI
jgi:hypothetical protein